jgi:hypothetical protein
MALLEDMASEESTAAPVTPVEDNTEDMSNQDRILQILDELSALMPEAEEAIMEIKDIALNNGEGPSPEEIIVPEEDAMASSEETLY